MDDIIDPVQIWIDLCLCKPEAQDYCQLFLHNYAEEGTEHRVSLNDEGFDKVKTVAAAKTVLDAWRDLIVHVDKTILKDKRAEDPARAAQWTLRHTAEGTWKTSGSPVNQISRVINLFVLQRGFCLKLTAYLVDRRRISASAGALSHSDV